MNKFKVALKELGEIEIKLILVIPCWILDIQILLSQHIDLFKIRKNPLIFSPKTTLLSSRNIYTLWH